MEILSPKNELAAFLSLVSSQEWKLFLDIKVKHAEYLQQEINRYLEKGEYRLADRAQAKLEDNYKDIEILNKRIQQLKNNIPQEEGFTND